ncbi:MAG: maltokinase N-terminal cap-like domain-containing protein [Propionibacteriaceae bacterium]
MRITDDATRTALLTYITGSRWFGGKGRRAELVAITPLPWLQPGDSWPAVRIEIAEIAYPEGTELYQLLLSYYPEPQPQLDPAVVTRVQDDEFGALVCYDAVRDPAATSLLLTSLIDGVTHRSPAPDGDQVVDFRPSRTGVLTSDLPGVVFGGQQSNTSIMYGDTAMLKLFRRIELGRNLDIEVHDQLSRAGSTDVAQLYGWVEGRWTSSTGGAATAYAADLAMMVEKLAQATDGWELALTTLDGSGDSEGDPDSFVCDATALGAALAHIHVGLREAFADVEIPGEAVADVMSGRLQQAVGVAPALKPYIPGLLACFDRLRSNTVTGQRVHGDFHLGQTLSTPQGWKIIDFEGEPVKTMAERLAPDSPARDVAGMLRSFAYAAASRPGPNALTWADHARAGFLVGYEAVLGTQDPTVLAAYEADKAVYEVVYETRNRPDWIHIPLAAVAQIVGAQASKPLDAAREDTP